MKFSKVLAVILSVVLLISAVPAVIFAEETAGAAASVEVDSVSATRGKTVDVNITFKNMPGVTAATFQVTYPEGITLSSVAFNKTLGGMSGTSPSLDSTATVNWFNGLTDFSGDFVFATLTFAVADDATLGDKAITLTYDPADICDIFENDVVFTAVNGKIAVINCAHDNTEVRGAVAATCTTAGYTGDTYCLDCGTKVLTGQVIDALSHDYKSVVTEPNCTERGYTTYTCSRCKDSYTDNYIAALGHKFGNWVVTKKPTSSKAGSKSRTCSLCGVSESKKINAGDPVVEIATKKSRTGKTVSIDISLKNNPGITSFGADVSFGSELKLKSVVYNRSLGGLTNAPYSLESPVRLNWSNGGTDVAGDLVFATLTFEVPADMEPGFNDITLAYDPEDVADINYNNVDFAIIGGGIEVIDHIPGDINDDGKVNNKDLTRLFQYLSKWNVEVNEAALDVNGDNKVNNKDLTRLFQYLSKWDVVIY